MFINHPNTIGAASAPCKPTPVLRTANPIQPVFRFRTTISALILAFLSLLPLGSLTTALAATSGISVTSVNLRAGPSTRYPVVTVLPRNASLAVYGCSADRSWCDIDWGGSRGWVAASYIQVFYRGQPTVLTASVAPAVGIATVAFSVAYWDAHYHAQPWHGHWNRYYVGGGSRSAVAGCNDNGCGAAAVTRGPHGGKRAVAGGCNDERCAAASVTRGPRGNVKIRHGSINRP